MNDPNEQPLVLVVDDDPEFREEILPEALARLGVRIVTAKDVLEGCMVSAEHGSGSKDPLSLVVLDMHMPRHAKTTTIAVDGGIQFLLAHEFTGCPVVVFTAYPSYENCARAVRAGAAAYLPKGTQDTYGGPEGGIDQLVEICRGLLDKRAKFDTPIPPDHEWLAQNYDWLRREFGGSWVAFVPRADASLAGIAGIERAGLVIVGRESRESLAQLIAGKLPLLSAIPPIAYVEIGQ